MMNQFFAEMYGTPGADENLEKTAQAEAFVKLAVDNGIDISQLSDEQIAELWNATFEGEEEKTAEASDEQLQQLYAQANEEFSGVASQTDMQKQAEAFGQQAAHAFYAELQEIEKVAGNLSNLGEYAAGAAGKLKGVAGKIKDVATGKKAREAAGEIKRMKAGKVPSDYAPLAREKKKLLAGAAETAGAYGGAGLAAGGTAYGASKLEKKGKGKTASAAIDKLAAHVAYEKLAEAEWNEEEAAERLNAVLTLGAGESEKIAHAADTDQAIEIRAYELMELAGYPVSWE